MIETGLWEEVICMLQEVEGEKNTTIICEGKNKR